MLRVTDLTRYYDTLLALDRITFEVQAGTLCGLLGPNGSGKSTLFKLLTGLLEPDRGEIRMLDETIHFGDHRHKFHLGYAPEEPEFYEYLTGYEFLQFIAAAKGLRGASVEQAVRRWLDFFDMIPKADDLILNYSHGMRQKTSLSAALIGTPKILLLDEATNGLDPESSYKVKTYLRDFCQNGGVVFLSSHVVELIENLCDRILILNQGRLSADLNPADLERIRQEQSLERYFMSRIANPID